MPYMMVKVHGLERSSLLSRSEGILHPFLMHFLAGSSERQAGLNEIQFNLGLLLASLEDTSKGQALPGFSKEALADDKAAVAKALKETQADLEALWSQCNAARKGEDKAPSKVQTPSTGSSSSTTTSGTAKAMPKTPVTQPTTFKDDPDGMEDEKKS